MNCDICFEPFGHSIRKPFSLACPHTYCSSYDKLKADAFKAFIELNEIKQDLKMNREQKLKSGQVRNSIS